MSYRPSIPSKSSGRILTMYPYTIYRKGAKLTHTQGGLVSPFTDRAQWKAFLCSLTHNNLDSKNREKLITLLASLLGTNSQIALSGGLLHSITCTHALTLKAVVNRYLDVYDKREISQWINPTGGKIREGDTFGSGVFGSNRSYGKHTGVDLIASSGQNVLSATAGMVDKIGYPYGDDLSFRYVSIKTSDDYIVRHLYVEPTNDLKKGVNVSAGQVIGICQSLQSRYPGITDHVHLDIKYKNQWIDPSTLIPIK